GIRITRGNKLPSRGAWDFALKLLLEIEEQRVIFQPVGALVHQHNQRLGTLGLAFRLTNGGGMATLQDDKFQILCVRIKVQKRFAEVVDASKRNDDPVRQALRLHLRIRIQRSSHELRKPLRNLQKFQIGLQM